MFNSRRHMRIQSWTRHLRPLSHNGGTPRVLAIFHPSLHNFISAKRLNSNNPKSSVPVYFAQDLRNKTKTTVPVYFGQPSPAQPPTWSTSSRWVRWPGYLGICFTGLIIYQYATNKDKVPYTDRWRRTLLPKGAFRFDVNESLYRNPELSTIPDWKNTLYASVIAASGEGGSGKEESEIIQAAYKIWDQLIAANKLEDEKFGFFIATSPDDVVCAHNFNKSLVINTAFLDLHNPETTLAAHLAVALAPQIMGHYDETSLLVLTWITLSIPLALLLPATIKVKSARLFTLPIVAAWIVQPYFIKKHIQNRCERETDVVALSFLEKAGFDQRISWRYWNKQLGLEYKGTGMSEEIETKKARWASYVKLKTFTERNKLWKELTERNERREFLKYLRVSSSWIENHTRRRDNVEKELQKSGHKLDEDEKATSADGKPA